MHHGTNELRSEESAWNIASNVINVALYASNEKKNTVYFSGLTVRYDKYDRKEKEDNVILEKKS